jgi:pimeloyl-ACP methyl ester carboxylesterase
MAPILHSRIEGEGFPLLIIHGFMGMSDNWKSFAPQYASLGYEVHVLDLRNHGKSFHSPEFNYVLMVHDVLNYMQSHQFSQCDIIGHSMGGKVAMLLAVQHANLIRKMVVADIGPKYYAPHHQDILTGLNAVDFSIQPDRAQVEEMLYPYIPDYGTRQFLMKNVYWKTPGQLAFRFNLEAFNDHIEEVGKALPEQTVFYNPTLFLRGGNSRYIVESDWEGIQRHFPQAVLDTIPDVGHWLHAENPKAFFEITARFLQS